MWQSVFTVCVKYIIPAVIYNSVNFMFKMNIFLIRFLADCYAVDGSFDCLSAEVDRPIDYLSASAVLIVFLLMCVLMTLQLMCFHCLSAYGFDCLFTYAGFHCLCFCTFD